MLIPIPVLEDFLKPTAVSDVIQLSPSLYEQQNLIRVDEYYVLWRRLPPAFVLLRRISSLRVSDLLIGFSDIVIRQFPSALAQSERKAILIHFCNTSSSFFQCRRFSKKARATFSHHLATFSAGREPSRVGKFSFAYYQQILEQYLQR